MYVDVKHELQFERNINVGQAKNEHMEVSRTQTCTHILEWSEYEIL